MRVTEELTDIEKFVNEQMQDGVYAISEMITKYIEIYLDGISGPEMHELQVEMEQAKRKFTISRQNKR